jgi:hypothetical protein
MSRKRRQDEAALPGVRYDLPLVAPRPLYA